MAVKRGTSCGCKKAWSILKPLLPFGEYHVNSRRAGWASLNASRQPSSSMRCIQPSSIALKAGASSSISIRPELLSPITSVGVRPEA